jgi:tRNA (adenine22-N1)-methyltransferase
MNLRIAKIADMVKPGVIAADIGTDHAFLPILLMQKKTAEKVYACDINEGPLKAAQRNIAIEGLSGHITTILCSGFDNVPADADCAIIAGMGFYTCRDILEKAMNRLPDFRQIIVEVNRNTPDMRKWISDHHFTIDNEVLIHEKGFDYIAISFTVNPHEELNEEEILCGTDLLVKSEGYEEYCERMIAKIDEILKVYKKEDARKEHLLLEKSMWQKAKDKTR